MCAVLVASFDVPAIDSLVVSICCDHFLLVDVLQSAEDFLGFVTFMIEIGCPLVLHVMLLLFDCPSFLFVKLVCCCCSTIFWSYLRSGLTNTATSFGYVLIFFSPWSQCEQVFVMRTPCLQKSGQCYHYVCNAWG